MSADLPADVRATLIAMMSDPLRLRVYDTIYERPGVTVAQVAARVGEPARRVRHQVERLIAGGLIAVDGESARRNTRERHYRALHPPLVLDEGEECWSDEERRKLALAALRQVIADIGRATRAETFGARPEHTEVCVPGEVDEQGWEELAAIMLRTLREIEATMSRSAERLRAEGGGGFEATSVLLLFEAPPWDAAGEERQGPRS